MSVTYSHNLAHSLQRAAALAAAQSRKLATPEDLLLALIDDPDARNVMRALRVDVEQLGRELAAYMEAAVDEADKNIEGPPGLSNLTADVRRILRLARLQARTSGRGIVTGADVLVELLSEPAGHFLKQQGVTGEAAARHAAQVVVKDEPIGSAAETPAAASAGPLANVLLLNDDHTPMDFVVYVLEEVFEMDRDPAMELMLEVHHAGSGDCGAFPDEVARAKVVEVLDLAREHRHPLQCVLRRVPPA